MIEKGRILFIVCVYDIIITSNDTQDIEELKAFLQGQFNTKDLGRLRYFLGIEVARSILEERDLMGAKHVETPIAPSVKLCVDQCELLSSPYNYQRLVKKLNYLTITRLDISFAVSVISQLTQFMSALRSTHMEAGLRIMRNLKSHLGSDLFYGVYRGIHQL